MVFSPSPNNVVERVRGWFAQSGQGGGPYNDREKYYGCAAAAAINQAKGEHFLNEADDAIQQFNSSHILY
jgi:hypothetical protein